jgi:hypothetical protein
LLLLLWPVVEPTAAVAGVSDRLKAGDGGSVPAAVYNDAAVAVAIGVVVYGLGETGMLCLLFANQFSGMLTCG